MYYSVVCNMQYQEGISTIGQCSGIPRGVRREIRVEGKLVNVWQLEETYTVKARP